MFRIAFVIPCFSERDWISNTISSLEASMKFSPAQKNDVHAVVVINHPLSACAQTLQNNADTHRYLQKLKSHSNLTLHMIVCQEPLAHGVGQARKIGMDYACKEILHDQQDYLISLDADTLVDASFLYELYSLPSQNAWTSYFAHPIGKTMDEQDLAIIHYELYLRYLAQGLAYAGSAFSYVPMGSTFGLNKKLYQQSGGMLEKDATEDFHFLNKLRKITQIQYLPQLKVYPAARKSKRVYLGTGFYLNQPQPQLWLPTCKDFAHLKHLNAHIHSFWEHPTLQGIEVLSDQHGQFLAKIQETLIKQKNNCRSADVFYKRTLDNFDALNQLRYLKLLKKQNLSPLKQSLHRQACTLLNMDMKKIENTLNYYRKLTY